MTKYTLILINLISWSLLAAPESQEFDSKGLNEIWLENVTGKINVSGSVENLKTIVTATKNKFSDNCKMSIERSGNNLIIKVERSNKSVPAEECDVDFDLKVPRLVNLDITSISGNLTSDNTKGDIVFNMGNGNIVTTAKIKKLEGILANGNIIAKSLIGSSDVQVDNGDVNLTYGYGEEPLTGELEIKTNKGNATVKFPQGTKIQAKLTSKGDLINEMGNTENAPFKVSMKSTSGNLKIKSN
ncbi:MAG: hypothetical protein U0T83_02935 [Bacteriovoracaceae bacterium]